jgi:hypothetical protein
MFFSSICDLVFGEKFFELDAIQEIDKTRPKIKGIKQKQRKDLRYQSDPKDSSGVVILSIYSY